MKLMINKKALHGEILVPSDKSISHRSIMFGAIAEGPTHIRHFLRAEDCLSTMRVFRALGVEIKEQNEEVIVYGRGFQGLKKPNRILDVGNSGTTIRLMMGILAGQNFEVTMSGDHSIQKRPMDRVISPLRKMGAKIKGANGTEFAPIILFPSSRLQAIEYTMPLSSAQVKSAIILAALQAEGETIIHEREQTRDHTEKMLEKFGGQIKTDGHTIKVKGGQKLVGQNITIPGDISSAAFFIVAASIVPSSEVVLKNVGLNPTRTGILDVLKEMGGHFSIENENSLTGILKVKSAQLRSTVISGAIIPRLIDELPIIALLSTQAEGTTIIKDAAELKVKETNRIDAVANELNKMGACITPTDDGLIIRGKTKLHAAEVTSYGDHRIGMMLQIAALLVDKGEVRLHGGEAVAISYPRFFEDLKSLIHD